MNQKIYLPLLFLLALFLKDALCTPLPSKKKPFIFYSNQSRVDLKHSLLKSLAKAEKQIWISVYTLTDSHILQTLNQKADHGIDIRLIVDKKQINALRKKLSKKIQLISVKQKGLMHQKIFLIDATIFIGSSNLTTSSLRMHDNLMLGLYEPAFSKKVQKGLFENDPSIFPVLERQFQFFTLPSFDALEKVIDIIQRAKKSIYIAMFTFIHPKIFEALKEAQARGVIVRVVLDYLSHKGASKKMASMLKEASIGTAHNRGMQLMHHKFGLIDEKVLIMGSTNWTRSAFEKNQDCLLILPDLSRKDQTFMRTLWRNLWWESKKIS